MKNRGLLLLGLLSCAGGAPEESPYTFEDLDWACRLAAYSG